MKTRKATIRNRVISVFLCLLMVFTSGPITMLPVSAAGTSTVDNSPRLELNFNKNWKFHLGDVAGAHRSSFDDSSWTTVDLPYDFSIIQAFTVSGTETESGFLPGGTGWYRKKFALPSEYSGKSVLINFDQSYNNTYVYINGKLVAENHYGYNSFSVDISSELICDGTTSNTIAVKVVNDIPSSRWYSGSGLISDVTMTIVDKVHVSLYGTKVTTPNLASSNGSNGTTSAVVTVQNDNATTKSVTVEASVLNSSGTSVGSSSGSLSIGANSSAASTLSISVTNPTLWSVNSPTLYTLRVVLKEGTTVLDQYDTEFGYRYINWDATNGFSLNGQKMKLNGVSMHHDQGALGANQEYDAIYRQVSILKEMGCNAIRTSHNVCSSTLLKVCNELGMLVMEELFDGWFETKGENNVHDFSEYFNVAVGSSNNVEGKLSDSETWAQFVVTQTVKRDRNNPSIVIWSLGNELNPTGMSTQYQTAAQNMQNWIKALDDRPTTHGDNKQGNDSIVTAIDRITDVVGGNYYPSAWTTASKRLGKPFIGTETVSSVGSRGVYRNAYSDSPASPSQDASWSSTHYANTSTHQINAYDASYVNWGNSAADSLWYVLNNTWYSGQFVWTGFDYIGEPTPWWTNVGTQATNPNPSPNSSYFGIIDTAGFAKDSYYLYRSIWNFDDAQTTLHLVPGTWESSNLNIDSNGYVNVVIYSNAPVVKLYSGDTLIGTATGTKYQTYSDISDQYCYYSYDNASNNSTLCKTGTSLTATNDRNLYAKFQVKYDSVSNLNVKAFQANGTTEITNTVGTTNVKKNTSASQIAVSVWNGDKTMTADADSYRYIEITAKDADGNFVNDYNGTLNIDLTGVGEIVGVDNGNAATTQKFQQKSALTSDTTATIQMFNGKALVIVKSTEETGTVNVTVTPQNTALSAKSVSLTSQAEVNDELTDEFEEVVDQSNLTDLPATSSKRDELMAAVDALEAPGNSTKTYELYTPLTQTTLSYLPDGEYIITGSATNSAVKGIMTHSINSRGGLSADGGTYSSSSLPSASADKWTFERQSDGTYYIYYIDSSNVKQYINLSGTGTNGSGSLSVSTTAQGLTVTLNTSANTITIAGPNGAKVNYYGSGNNQISIWQDGTALSLYQVNNGNVTRWTAKTPTVENGNYVLYNQGYAMTDTTTSATNWAGTAVTGIAREAATVSGTTLTPADGVASELTFTVVDPSANTYYVQNASGQYLNITSGTNNNLRFSSTKQALTLTKNSDGTIALSSGNTYIDHFTGDAHVFSTYSGSATEANKKITLYAPVGGTDPGKQALYDALKSAIEILPDDYTSASYNNLLAAIEEGIAVYNDASSNSAAYQAAADAILDAVEALAYKLATFGATIFKYGYNTAGTTAQTKYSIDSTNTTSGGAGMTLRMINEMKNLIAGNTDLMNQINALTGVTDDNRDAIVEAYAKLYTLRFIGKPIADQTVDINNPYGTAYSSFWNNWWKPNTQGAGETQNEGASVHGLFSTTRNEVGLPTYHEAYSDPLPYINTSTTKPDDGDYYGSTNLVTVSNVELPPLRNISVYVGDLFSENDLGSSISGAASTQYDKYHWTVQFPFRQTTNEYGVSSYVYDSNSSDYVFQAYYDDANHTANATLTNVTADWQVKKTNANSYGKGFFPFNYQLNADGTSSVDLASTAETANAEKGIYHFGMSFTTEFYIPESGHYGDGNDIVFDFSGDDDVLVYIDNVLVLDNGGIHGARSASINFSQQSVTYQYVADTAHNSVVNSTEGITFSYDTMDADDNLTLINSTAFGAQNRAALEKLHAVATDGKTHTFSFYYLERGSNESNCYISFNIQKISDYVSFEEQTLVADYGLPLTYNVKSNNTEKDTKPADLTYNYIGMTSALGSTENQVQFKKPTSLTEFPESGTLSYAGQYGDFTINRDGTVTYQPKTMSFTNEDSFYLCAEVTGDTTYEEGTVYYVYEKVTVIPATTVYYEDDFNGGLSYTDGSIPTGETNSANYGIWQEALDDGLSAKPDSYQAADLVGDVNANVYGHDDTYASMAQYSNSSAHYVTVSAKNNPNSKFSGGAGSAWPKAEFSFAGTGFDLISVTSKDTGTLNVVVKDADGNLIKNHTVNTYYGYSYGQLYADAAGNPTLTVTETPLYFNADKTDYTRTPTYYDANMNVVTENSGNLEEAFAFGWIVDKSLTDNNALYQIPVIKVEGLAYGTYTVTITPMYSSKMDISKTGEYDLYIDAIRIYDPAGVAGSSLPSPISSDYTTDKESNPDYLELRNMLIGADEFTNTGINAQIVEGVVFIDGIPRTENISDYLAAGPNNELYLTKDQAVAFEIWANQIPHDVQIGAKAVGNAQATMTIANLSDQAILNSLDLQIASSSDMYYSIIDSLNLTWTRVTNEDGTVYTDENGNTYFTTGTIVIRNNSTTDTILSVTNIKWTFPTAGYGYYKQQAQTTQSDEPVAEEASPFMLMSTRSTFSLARAAVLTSEADLAIEPDDVTVASDTVTAGDEIVVKVSTSTDVDSLIIRDANGKVITPEAIESYVETIDDAEVKQWTVTLSETESGTYTYSITGAYENGYTAGDEPVVITVTVEAPPEEPELTFLEKLIGFFERLVDFFKKLVTLVSGGTV